MSDTRTLYSAAPAAVTDTVAAKGRKARELVNEAYTAARSRALPGTPDPEAVNDALSAAAQVAAEAVAEVCRLVAKAKGLPLGPVASTVLTGLDMRAARIIIAETRG